MSYVLASVINKFSKSLDAQTSTELFNRGRKDDDVLKQVLPVLLDVEAGIIG